MKLCIIASFPLPGKSPSSGPDSVVFNFVQAICDIDKSIKIIGFIVASAGLAYVVKQIMHHKEHLSGWHKIKVEDEKRTGSRYGSNPVRY